MAKKRIAIIGAGISGLGCAFNLRQHSDFDITIYESGKHIGGHSNTVDITIDTPSGPIQQGVDTGFLVFRSRAPPQLDSEIRVESGEDELLHLSDLLARYRCPPSTDVRRAGDERERRVGGEAEERAEGTGRRWIEIERRERGEGWDRSERGRSRLEEDLCGTSRK